MLPVLLALAACLAAPGCGRKATVEDCEQIVRRIAELELQGVVSKEELGTEVDQAQRAFRERALADCVGRRITEKSLACVATAKTAESVIDDCFD
jgi:N-acetylglutamate synthase-like GNAT family acetyltransferase